MIEILSFFGLVVLAVTTIGIVWMWVECRSAPLAPPPYPVPRCNQNCRQGRDCDCYERSCDMTPEQYDNWPFPRTKP